MTLYSFSSTVSSVPEYIAYRGKEYTIEWYFNHRGYSQALDYFENLSPAFQDKLLYLFKAMGDLGQIKNLQKFRNEGDEIYAFKPQPDRFLCFFFKGRKIIVTNAFRKKQNKLPKNEKEKALKYKTDYLTQVQKGEYYE